jgi:tetratricopeptide (TPR) repeat protein
MAARPLVNFSLALNYWTGGLEPRGYHAWNLGVHLTAALVLFGVVRRTLEGERLRERMGRDAANVALVAALWWALHPLVSEVVDYTTQRTTAMMGLFFLTTLYCAIRAVESPHPGRWHVWAVIACACGMASKEAMVGAPIAVALYDRLLVYSSVRDAWPTRKALYLGLASTWAGLAGLMWVWPRSTVGFAAGDWWMYLLNQAQLIPHYLRLALWPDALVLDYGLLRAIPLRDAIGGGMLIAAILAITLVALVRWPGPGFLGAVFFLTLAPTSSVVPIVSEVGAERRMYLPLAALAVLLVLTGRTVLRWAESFRPPGHGRLVTTTAFIITAAWLGSLAMRTAYRNAEYADAVSLWRGSVEQRPHGRARLAYGLALVKAGQSDAALPHLQEAARDYERARYALGVELAARGDSAAAIRTLDAFVADDPAAANRVPARLLLGRLLFAEARFEESAQRFEAVAALAPSNIDAQVSLGDIRMAQKRYAEAAAQYQVALGLQPERADWLIKLGRALDLDDRPDAAAGAYRTALAVQPAWRLVHLHLAEMWLRRGRAADAIPHAREAVRIESDDSEAHHLLGAALAQNGQLAEAMEHFRAAVTLDPGNEFARSSLSRATNLLDPH